MNDRRVPLFIGIIAVALIAIGIMAFRMNGPSTDNARVQEALKGLPNVPPPANDGKEPRRGGVVPLNSQGGAPR